MGNWAAVYPLNSDDIYNENNHKRLQVLAFNNTAGNAIDQWQFSKAFAAESPSKRLYLLAEPVSFCVEGRFLYRYINYAFNSAQSDAPSLQVTPGVKRDLLGIYIANNLASNLFFTIEPVALQRNAVLNVNAQMRFNEAEVMNFNHEVHVPNVP